MGQIIRMLFRLENLGKVKESLQKNIWINIIFTVKLNIYLLLYKSRK